MPEMLAIALKGIPRDTYQLMTKYSTPAGGDPCSGAPTIFCSVNNQLEV